MKPVKIHIRLVIKLLLLLIIVLVSSTNNSYSQGKQGNIWCFGFHAGLNFNSGSPTSFTGGATSNLEGSATISDSAGNLLFYTDGMTVWDKNNAVMETGLMGHNSSTQSGVIVPHPTQPDTLYIFTIDATQNNLNNGLRYSVVAMSMRSGLGDVVPSMKNVLLSPSGVKMAEKISGVRHCNNEDIWVIGHNYASTNGNKFYSYRITRHGIVTTPVISAVGTNHWGADQSGLGNSRGYMKASPDGSRIAVAICYDGAPALANTWQLTNNYHTGAFEVFDFNYTSGVVSNPIKFYSTNYKGAYGIEFSPNNKVLYGSTWGAYGSALKIWQWNLAAGSAAAVQSSATQIASVSSGGFGALQIASNGKIYSARYNQTYISVINYPNKIGSSCGYTNVGATLGGSRRSRYGLPTFVQSYFDPNLGYSYVGNFEDMITEFIIEDSLRIDSVLWLFDDTCAGQQNYSTSFTPSYTYCDTGDYQVRLIIWKCNIVDTITHTVVMHPRPVAAFSINDTLQCFNENSFQFTNSSTITKGSITYHKWYFGDGDTSNLQNPVHTYNTPGVYTIKLVEKSDYGGYDSTTHAVEVIYSPVAFFDINDSSQCIKDNSFNFDNNSYIATSSSLDFYWDVGDGDTFHRPYVPLHSYLSIDSFFVQIIVTSDSGCVDTHSRYAYTRPMPVAGFTIDDTAQCLSGNSFTFTDTSSVIFGSVSQRWQFGDGDSSSSQNPTYSYSSHDTLLVQLIATTNHGCRDTTNQTTYVWPMPSADYAINDSVQCLYGNSFSFTDSSSIAWGNLNYRWFLGDNDTALTANVTHTYLSADTFTVQFFAISDLQCFDSLFKTVIVHPDPISDFTINDSSQCIDGNSFVYTNTSAISSGSLTYKWYFGDNDSSTSTNSTHSYSTADTFSVQLIATSALICRDTITKNAYVHPMPVADFTINDTLQCLTGNSFIFNDTSTVPSGSIAIYFWDFGNGDTSYTQSPTYTYLASDTFSVKHVVTTDNGCQDSLSKGVLVYPMPLNLNESSKLTPINNGLIAYFPLNYNGNDSSSNGHNASVSGALASSGVVGGSYYFDGNDYIEKSYHADFTPGTQPWSISAWVKIPTGTYSGTPNIVNWYRCGVTTCGASDKARYSLETNANSNLIFKIRDNTSAVATGITSSLVYDDNQWHFLTGVYDPAKDSMWLYIDNCLEGKVYAPLGTLTDGSNSVPLSIGRVYRTGWGAPTNYFTGNIDEVRIYNRTLNNKEIQALYKLGKPLDIEVENEQICQSDSTYIKLISPEHGVQYQLYNSVTMQNIGASQSSTCADTLYFSTGSISDTTYFKLSAFNPTTSCTTILDTTFKIYNYAQPVVDFIINDSSQCFTGNSFVFTNLSSISTGTLGYLWDFGDNTSSTSTHPTHSYSSSNNFTVKLIATSDHQCRDSAVKTTITRPMPQADFNINDSLQCFLNNQINFTDNTSYSYSSYSLLWDFGDGSTSTQSNPVHSYSTPDTYYVKLIATSDFGCKDSITKTVYIMPMPVAEFSVNDSTQCLSGNQFNFTNLGTISSGSYTLSWDFDDGNSSSSVNPVHTYSTFDSFMVQLVLSSGFGCNDSVSHNMIVYPMPVADFSINDSTQCFNQHFVDFTNQTTIPYGSVTYYWNFGDGNSSTSSDPNHIYSTDDSFYVTLLATSNYSCSDSVAKNMYVYPSPDALFTINDSAQCFNENSFLFKNTKSRAELWYFGDGDTSSQDWPSHKYTWTDTFQVTFIAHNDYSCFDTSYKTVIVFPSPVTDFTIADSNQCINENLFSFTNNSTIGSGSQTYVWDFGDGNSVTSTNASHQYASDDTFQVKLVSTSALGCKDSVIKNIYVFPSPQLSIAVNDSQQCFNENNFVFSNTSTINSGTQAYNWNFGDGNSSSATAPNHVYNTDDTFSVILIATSGLSCKDTADLTSYVFPSPEPDFTINDSNQCFNEHLFNFTNLSTINTGTQTYLWNFGDGNSSTSTNTAHQYATDDTFTVKLLITSDLSCQDSISKDVYVFPSPQLSIAVNDSQQCFNENNFVFANTSTINTGSQAYSWNFGDGNSSSATAPNHIYNTDDTFSVILIATSGLSCKDTAYLTSYVFPSPVPDFTINDSNQCFNEHLFNFTNLSTINTGTQTYLWNFGDGNSSTSTNTAHQYATDDTFTVKLLITSDLSCQDSVSKDVYVFPSPQLSIAVNDSQQCFNENNFVFSNTSTINSGTQTYNWNFGDGNSSSATAPNHIYNTDDTFNVILIATSGLSCKDTADLTSYVFPSPEPDFTINDSNQCFNEHLFNFTNLSTINTGTQTYLWNFGDGNSSTSTNTAHQYATDDTFTVKLLITSDLSCQDSISKDVYVFPSPQLSIAVNDSQQCFNENNFVFANTSTINSGTQAYNWNFGDGNSSTATAPNHIYNTDDTFNVILIATSGLSCKDTADLTSYVFPSPEPDFTINDSSQCIFGNNFQYINFSTINYGSMGYLWTFGDGSSATSTNSSHQYNTDDTFLVKLLITSGLGCQDSLEKKAYVHPMPIAVFTLNDTTQCLSGNNFVFSNSTSINSGNMSYVWIFGDNNSSTQTSPSHSYGYHDTFGVKLMVTSGVGCQDSAFSTSYVFPMPETDFSVDDSFQCLSGNMFTFTNTTTIASGSMSYLWLFGDGVNATTTNSTHSYATHDTFLVELMTTSALSCQDSMKRFVIVNPMPDAQFSINDNSQCLTANTFAFTNSTSISSGSNTYIWDFGDSNYSSNSNPTHTYSYFDTFTVKLLATSLFDCPDSAFKDLYVHPMPIADFIIDDSSQCLEGNKYIFTNTSIIPHGNQSYLWDFGDGNSSTQINDSHSYANPGTYQVKLISTSGESCPDSLIKLVYVRPMPVADYALYDTAQCFERNAFGFTNLSTILTGTMTYQWDFGDTSNSTLTNPVHTYNYADTFTVKLIATSDYGCLDSISGMTYVHVHPQPDVDFIITDSLQCLLGNLFDFTNHSTIGSGTFSNNWEFGDNGTSNLFEPTYSYSNHDTFSVKLLLISDYGCKDSLVLTTYVHPMPVADFIIDDSSQCLFENDFTFTDASTIPWGNMIREWFFNDGDTAFVTSTKHTYLYHDTFDVSLRVTSIMGCIDSISYKAYVHPMPTADFMINDSTQCLRGNLFEYTDLSTINSGLTFNSWWFGDSDTSTLTHPTHFYLNHDTFTIKMRVSSAMGCLDSIEKTSYVFPMPIAEFSINDSNQCFNENSFSYQNNTTIPWGSLGFKWDFGDGNGNLQYSPNHIYSADDTFYVKLIAESGLGCLDSISKASYVFPSPEPGFDINDSIQCFAGNNFAFTNTSTINTGSSTYNWTFGDGNSSTQISPQHNYGWDDTFNIQLIATSDLSCLDTIDKTGFVFPSPVADYYMNDSDQCFNGNYYLFNDTTSFDTSKGYLSWRWDFNDGDSSFFTNTSHVFQSDDTFYVEMLVWSNLGCYDSISKQIVVFPNPVAGYDINDSQQCFNGNSFLFNNTTSINSGSMNYVWTFGDGSGSTQLSPSHSYLNDDTFNVKLIITSGLFCSDSIVKKAYVFPSPVPEYNINDSQQCFNYNEFIFSNLSTINTGYFNSYWNFGDGDTALTQNSSHNYQADDTFQVKLVLTSNLGCQDSIIKSTYIFPNPIADYSINDSQQCVNENSFIFSNLSTINTGSITYLWAFGDASSSNAPNPTYSYFLDDTFSVQLVAVSDLNCLDTMVKTTYVFPSPVTQFNIDDNSQCLLDNEVNFTNNSTINSGSLNYLWSFGDGSTDTKLHTQHQYAYYDTFTVKLLLTSDLMCQDSLSKPVYIHPMPDASFSINDTDQCLAGNQFSFVNLSNLIYGNMYYNWSFGDGGSSSSANPSHTYGNHDTFNVALIVITANACRDTANYPVVVHPMPVSDFDVNIASQCLRGNLFEYTNTTTIPYSTLSYYWDLGDLSDTNTIDVKHSYNDHGSYTVKLVSTSSHYCQDSIETTVYVRPMPVADFSVNDSLQCLTGNDFVFTNLSTVATGKLNYYWILEDGRTSTDTNIQHTYGKDTTYSVMLITNSDAYNCADTMIIPVVVHPMPKAEYSFTLPCIGQEIQFNDESTINSPDTVNQWIWDFKDGDSSMIQNPLHIFTASGTYQVKLLVTSDKFCLDSILHKLTIYDYVDPTIIDVATVYDDLEVFVEWLPVAIGRPKTFVLEKSIDNVNFNHLSDIPAYIYEYYDVNVDVDAFSYIYRLKIIDSCDYHSPYSNIGKTILLTINNEEEFPVLNWTAYENWAAGVIGYDIFVKDEKTQIFENIATVGQNTFTYTDEKTNYNQADYCYKIQAVRLGDAKISESNILCAPTPFNFHVPNTFTPDGDYLNDSFTIKGTFIVEYQISIFNRWGELMFTSNDINNPWDGKFKGQLCPMGQYFYTVSARGTGVQKARKDGTVLLLR